MADNTPHAQTGPTGCPAALSIAGEHYWCDWPTENGKHPGWAHASTKAQAIWSGDETIDQILLSDVEPYHGKTSGQP